MTTKPLLKALLKPRFTAYVVCGAPPASGPCDLPPNDICGKEKAPNVNIPSLQNLLVQGADDGFTITWDTTAALVGYSVRLLYRQQVVTPEGYYDSPKDTDWSTGTISSASGLPIDTIFWCWIRAETEDDYGYWLVFQALTDVDWNSESELIYQDFDLLQQGTDIIIHGSP